MSRLAPFPVSLNEVTSPSAHRPLLIGFVGQIACGKSSSAAFLKDTYGGEVLAFADKLKQEVYDTLAASYPKKTVNYAIPGDPGEVFENLPVPAPSDGIEWVAANKSALRPFMQSWGDYKRSSDPLHYVNQTLSDVEKLIGAGATAIYVDDVRRKNEADALVSIGFDLIRISCGVEEQKARATERDSSFDPSTLQHITETDLLYYPVTAALNNSGPFFETANELRAVVHTILNR